MRVLCVYPKKDLQENPPQVLYLVMATPLSPWAEVAKPSVRD